MQTGWARIKWLLTRPVFGTRLIRRDARVDPAKFSEDEFPTWCMKCGYLLRALPSNICPECGAEFDRGRLLVQEYVLQRGALPWKQTPRYKVSKVFFIIAIGLLVLFNLMTQIFKPQIVGWLIAAGPSQAIWLLVGIRFSPYVLLIVSVVMLSKNMRQRMKKRRAVLAELPKA